MVTDPKVIEVIEITSSAKSDTNTKINKEEKSCIMLIIMLIL